MAQFGRNCLFQPLTDFDSIPTVGSQVGRYLFLREIAKGPFGPLYELRAEADTTGLGGLGRVVQLPHDLLPEVEQSIAEAAWESMELRHEFVLCVADVVFGKGWVTLIHDYAEGTLLRSLQRRAKERQSAFPVSIALRVVMDLLEGLDRNCGVCDASGITWSPGGTAATSLYLCGDGRTRSLDGQLMTTLIRAGQMRDHANCMEYVAPELVDAQKHPDERADVFAAGAVLWELLTGQELSLEGAVVKGQRQRPKLPSVRLSVPEGTSIPPGLTQATRAALEQDPSKRPATRSALRSALASAAELATYEKVIDFVDALLHRESTLFRLTLDQVPKLSDKLRSERPKPPRPVRDFELAKRVRPGEPPKIPKVPLAAISLATRLVPRHPEETQGTPSLPTTSTAVAPAVDKKLANRTLIGISPSPENSKPAEPAPALVPDAAQTGDTSDTVLIRNVASASTPQGREDPGLVPTFTPEFLPASPNVEALVQEVLQASPPPVRPFVSGGILDEHAVPAAAVGPAIDPASKPKSLETRVVQLSLPMLVIGLIVTVTVAVTTTIIIERTFSKNSTATSTSAAVAASPSLNVSPTAAPAPIPVADTPASPPASSVPTGESPEAPQTSTKLDPPAPVPNQSAATDNPAVPKIVARKRKRQYVPHGL